MPWYYWVSKTAFRIAWGSNNAINFQPDDAFAKEEKCQIPLLPYAPVEHPYSDVLAAILFSQRGG
jgi:hypothetical protein